MGDTGPGAAPGRFHGAVVVDRFDAAREDADAADARVAAATDLDELAPLLGVPCTRRPGPGGPRPRPRGERAFGGRVPPPPPKK